MKNAIFDIPNGGDCWGCKYKYKSLLKAASFEQYIEHYYLSLVIINFGFQPETALKNIYTRERKFMAL